jgi:hypothetical protein
MADTVQKESKKDRSKERFFFPSRAQSFFIPSRKCFTFRKFTDKHELTNYYEKRTFPARCSAFRFGLSFFEQCFTSYKSRASVEWARLREKVSFAADSVTVCIHLHMLQSSRWSRKWKMEIARKVNFSILFSQLWGEKEQTPILPKILTVCFFC